MGAVFFLCRILFAQTLTSGQRIADRFSVMLLTLVTKPMPRTFSLTGAVFIFRIQLKKSSLKMALGYLMLVYHNLCAKQYPKPRSAWGGLS